MPDLLKKIACFIHGSSPILRDHYIKTKPAAHTILCKQIVEAHLDARVHRRRSCDVVNRWHARNAEG